MFQLLKSGKSNVYDVITAHTGQWKKNLGLAFQTRECTLQLFI